MYLHFGIFAVIMFSMLVGTPAQRSPYLGSSDPGVLPQYLSGDTENRFGESSPPKEPPKIQQGTLETEDVYNRVSEWPDDHKPFWYLNSIAIQKQREQEQQQQQQQAQQAQRQRPSFFASRPRN